MLHLDQDTSSVILDFLNFEDMFNIHEATKNNLNSGNLYIHKYFHKNFGKSIEEVLMCRSCKREPISYLTKCLINDYLSEYNKKDNNLYPVFNSICKQCLIIKYGEWFKNNNCIKIHDSAEDYDNIIFYSYSLKRLTKYNSSKKCTQCRNDILSIDNLIGVLEYENEHKYQDTYHLECFIDKFFILESILSMSKWYNF